MQIILISFNLSGLSVCKNVRCAVLNENLYEISINQICCNSWLTLFRRSRQLLMNKLNLSQLFSRQLFLFCLLDYFVFFFIRHLIVESLQHPICVSSKVVRFKNMCYAKKNSCILYAKSSLIIMHDLGYIYNQTRLYIKTIYVKCLKQIFLLIESSYIFL